MGAAQPPLLQIHPHALQLRRSSPTPHLNNGKKMPPVQTNGSGATGGGGDAEEINTKELAQRISAELKRYSIPQVRLRLFLNQRPKTIIEFVFLGNIRTARPLSVARHAV